MPLTQEWESFLYNPTFSYRKNSSGTMIEKKSSPAGSDGYSADATVRWPLHHPKETLTSPGPFQSWHCSTKQVLISITKRAENLKIECACCSKNNWQLAQPVIKVGWNSQPVEQWLHSWIELLITLLFQCPSSFLHRDSQLCWEICGVSTWMCWVDLTTVQ